MSPSQTSNQNKSYDGYKNTAIVVLTVICIILIVWLFVRKGGGTKIVTIQNPTASSSVPANIQVVTKEVTSEDDSYTTDLQEPTVSGLSTPAVTQYVNQQIASTLDGLVEDFKSQTSDIKILSSSEKHSITVDLAAYNDVAGKVLTFQFENSTYFSGAAHPLTVPATLNLDAVTGINLTLDSVFASSTNYLVPISNYVKQNLQQKLVTAAGVTADQADGIYFPQGADPTPDNYESFIVTDKGINFLFGQYQVAPYESGEQQVLVPYSFLKPYLNPLSPVASLAH